MPQAVSRKQYRMMRAILSGKGGSSSGGRGTPPKSVAAKYTDPGKDAPEQHGENRGGTWGEHHHAKDKERVEAKRHERKKDKHKKHLKKGAETEGDLASGNAAACIVMDDMGRILLGDHKGGMAFPGGHMDTADNGDFATTAMRELHEEAGVIGMNPNKVWEGTDRGHHVIVYLVESYTGKPKSSKELKNIRWVEPNKIEWDSIRGCCRAPLKEFLTNRLGKTLKGMLALENLEKNIIRQKGDAVLEVTHGDALRLVGTGLFRQLKNAVRSMKDEDFKDVHIDTYTLSVRKHMSDIYSGRVSDGHKVVYQFTNKSLPEMTAALMSVFEWYLPEDEKLFDMEGNDQLSDDALHGGLNNLIDNYKRHNIANIYEEMEHIRSTIRNGMAVDLQQVEHRIMSLFDRLEELVHTLTEKHNSLATHAGDDVDELERKLRELQSKIDEMGKKPQKVEAFSANPPNKDEVIDNFYPYLSRPKVEIMPSGKITIMFGSDWQHLEKENFLTDMRAKTISKGKGNG